MGYVLLYTDVTEKTLIHRFVVRSFVRRFAVPLRSDV